MAKWPETKKDDAECRLFEDVNVLKILNSRLILGRSSAMYWWCGHEQWKNNAFY